MKKADSLSVDGLVKVAKIVFTEFGLSKKIISHDGINFTSDAFRQFCRKMNIEQAIIHNTHKHDLTDQVASDVILGANNIRIILE